MDSFDSDISFFISGHPLWFLCHGMPEAGIKRLARCLAKTALENVPGGQIPPLSPGEVEQILARHGYYITETSFRNGTPRIFAWSSEEEKRIYINRGALEDFLASFPEETSGPSPDIGTIRGLALAHEWFHLFFHAIPKPDEWGSLKRPARIIAEETAARLYAAGLLQVPFSPMVLDLALRKRGGLGNE